MTIIIAPGRRYLQLRGRTGLSDGRITIMPAARDERSTGRLTFRLPLPAAAPTRLAAESA
jgi:hypothetical protein